MSFGRRSTQLSAGRKCSAPAGPTSTIWKRARRPIERNSHVQAQLIEDLLDVSRIISGKLRLEVQRLHLGEVIEAALAAVMPAATAKGVRIHKVLDSLAGAVMGDGARLQQVIWNLLSNAVKFTPSGGMVQVLLERVNSHVEVSVVDTGMGIRPSFCRTFLTASARPIPRRPGAMAGWAWDLPSSSNWRRCTVGPFGPRAPVRGRVRHLP